MQDIGTFIFACTHDEEFDKDRFIEYVNQYLYGNISLKNALDGITSNISKLSKLKEDREEFNDINRSKELYKIYVDEVAEFNSSTKESQSKYNARLTKALSFYGAMEVNGIIKSDIRVHASKENTRKKKAYTEFVSQTTNLLDNLIDDTSKRIDFFKKELEKVYSAERYIRHHLYKKEIVNDIKLKLAEMFGTRKVFALAFLDYKADSLLIGIRGEDIIPSNIKMITDNIFEKHNIHGIRQYVISTDSRVTNGTLKSFVGYIVQNITERGLSITGVSLHEDGDGILVCSCNVNKTDVNIKPVISAVQKAFANEFKDFKLGLTINQTNEGSI